MAEQRAAGSVLSVGDTIWMFDGNRRKYGKDGFAIYREHFREDVITGETNQSWLVGNRRINKKTMREAAPPFGHNQWFTKEAMIDDIYINTHRHQIVALVQATADVNLLRNIAALVNYTPTVE